MAGSEPRWTRRAAVYLLPVLLLPVVYWIVFGMKDPSGLAGIEDSRWQLAAVNDTPVPPQGAPYFELSGGTISGFDGCNTFGGPVGDPGKIRRGQRGCPAGYTELPLDLADPSAHLDTATVDGDRLVLPLDDGGTAEFVRVEAGN